MPNSARRILAPALALAIPLATACWTAAYDIGTELDGQDSGANGVMDALSPADAGAAETSVPSFFIGADLSRVQEEEDRGEVFYDTDGTQKDILQILENHGFNYGRLRVFVDPLASDGYATNWLHSTTAYCDIAHTATMGARIKAAGMGFVIDLHMSDDWAEPPGQTGADAAAVQTTPLAWQGDSLSQLVTQVQAYTTSVVTQLVAAGARPDLVQIGNGIEAGMLFPLGSSSNWANLAQLLNAAIAGIKAVDGSIRIVLQLGLCGDNAGTRAWVDEATANGVAFDVLGESCYTALQGDPSTWQTNFTDLATRYPSLSFLVAEYAESSADLLGDVAPDAGGCTATSGPCNVWRRTNDIVHAIPDHRGLGAFVWEPTWFGEPLFDDAGKSTDPTGLSNPFDGGPRISLYNQIASEYGP